MLCPQLASAKYIDTWIKFFIHSFMHSCIHSFNGGHNFGHVMPMTLNMAETTVHGLLIPARVLRLCACVRWWPHHRSGLVYRVSTFWSAFFPWEYPFLSTLGNLAGVKMINHTSPLSLLWYVGPGWVDLSIIVPLHPHNWLLTDWWVVFALEFSFP